MGQPKSDLPLSEPTLLILAALWGGPLHGYAIRQSVLAMNPNRSELGNGTLYECLGRLEAYGWIEELPRAQATRRRCRTLTLTQQGKQALRGEGRRLVALVDLCRGCGIIP